MKEAGFTTELKNSLLAYGAWAYKIADMPHFKGMRTSFDVAKPCDLVVGYCGHLIAIECKLLKKPGSFGFGDLRDSQIDHLDAIQAAGCQAFVILNVRMPPGTYNKTVTYPRLDKALIFSWQSIKATKGFNFQFPTLLKMIGTGKITIGAGKKSERIYDLKNFLARFTDHVQEPLTKHQREGTR